MQARNLARLNGAGVKIAFGTDAGVSVAWTAHTELADMVAAGMTPAQVLVAATRTSAGVMRLDQLGTIAAGKSADFIVLDANPLDDITNTRKISDVYLRERKSTAPRSLRRGRRNEDPPMGTQRLVLFATLAAVISTTSSGAQAQKTVWDGVYTEEQAKRGEQLYGEKCAQCHGKGLGGVESAPALTGPTFYATWEGETLNALFERIRMSMPLDNPGSLSRAQNADIVAHMLRVAGYPTGSAPLEGQAGPLMQIRVLTYKP